MNLDTQRTGRIFGWFFIATFVTSIPARLLFVDGVGASWNDMRFVPGAGSETSLQLGAILEFLLIGANVATAVIIYPLVKRQSQTLALGYVTGRVMESANGEGPSASCHCRRSPGRRRSASSRRGRASGRARSPSPRSRSPAEPSDCRSGERQFVSIAQR